MLKAIKLHNVSLKEFDLRKRVAAISLQKQEVPPIATTIENSPRVSPWTRSDFMVEPALFVVFEVARGILLPNFKQLSGIQIAAGYGLYPLYLKNIIGAKNTLGVDTSPLNAQVAAKVGAPHIRADASALPFADQSLDFVFSLHFLDITYRHMDIDLIDKILREINRVLKPGGLLISSLESLNDQDINGRSWPSLGNTSLGINSSTFSAEIRQRYFFNLQDLRILRKQ